MSTVQQLIAAVIAAQRQLDDQIGKLNTFSTQINQVTSRVEASLQDSKRDYSQEMLQQLSQTKQQVEDTLQRLQAAKDKLNRLSMI